MTTNATKTTKVTNDSSVSKLLADNRAAMDEFIRVASDVPRREWTTPLGEGKWSPAQHVHHITLAYEAAVRDVRHGQQARLKGTANQRRLWRLVGLTQVMWMKKLPRGATAPREVQPPNSSPVRPALLAQLRDAADDFDAAMTEAWDSRPGYQLAHPYFGNVSLRQTIVICAVHTRHHTAAIMPSIMPSAAK